MSKRNAHLLDVLVFHLQDRFHVFHAIFDELVKVFVQFYFREEVANFSFILTLGSTIDVTLSWFASPSGIGCLCCILSCNIIRNILRYGADRGW